MNIIILAVLALYLLIGPTFYMGKVSELEASQAALKASQAMVQEVRDSAGRICYITVDLNTKPQQPWDTP